MKRQKNDAIDAEAICEAAQRTSMRSVAVKSEQQQAAGLVFRTRDELVRQRTRLINAIRRRLTEWVAPKGPSHVAMLADLIEEDEVASSLPEAAHAMFRLMLDLLADPNGKIADLDKEIARRAREDKVSRRLMIIPGIGSIFSQAANAGNRRARQQDGADRLGATRQARKLQSSGRSQVKAWVWQARGRRCSRSKEGSARRGRKNQMDSPREA